RGHTRIPNAPSNPAITTIAAELRFVMSGVTAGATAGGSDGLMRNVDGTPAQLENARIKLANSETFPLNDQGSGNSVAPGWPYDNLGVQIALGTDWLASGSMNMSRELKCADDLNKTYYGKHFTDKQLVEMVTTNAAFAIGAKNSLGMLKPGYLGDIAIFNART